MRRQLVLLLALILPASGLAATVETTTGRVTITTVADGFDVPWAFDFLPGGGVLVTERGGSLWLVGSDGTRHRITGTPDVALVGQGGLLDVTVARDFATSREVFLTYARRTDRGSGTALAVGRLSDDGRRLDDLRRLFQAVHIGRGGLHFGSRVIESPDGRLFVTLGERGNRDAAQDRGNHNGTIVRINRDGTVPADNPFIGQDNILPEIWSYGHRNPQGAALDARGQLWAVEHGAQGGDEINRIEKSANYGWPVISYGRHYSGAKIGEGTVQAGMEQPVFYWDPSIAPSGMAIYSGRLWPEWKGQFLVGSLKFDMISRLGGDPLQEIERITSEHTIRVRDISEAPDGAIWFLSEGRGALYRVTPE